MSDPILWHRLQFAFTITYHYLFPQLTMGLALLIVVLKAVALGAHGVMVGRGAYGRPWIAGQIATALAEGRDPGAPGRGRSKIGRPR